MVSERQAGSYVYNTEKRDPLFSMFYHGIVRKFTPQHAKLHSLMCLGRDEVIRAVDIIGPFEFNSVWDGSEWFGI